MANTERKPRITKGRAATAAGLVLSIGGIVSAITGGYLIKEENEKDTQTRTEIAARAALEFGRPAEDDFDKARDYMLDRFGGVDEKSEDVELLAVSNRLVDTFATSDERNVFLEKRDIINQETLYQGVKDFRTKDAGADNIDDAKIGTAIAGTISILSGTITLSGLAGAALATRRKEPKAIRERLDELP